MDSILFYLVFTSQLLVLSYFIPKAVVGRMEEVFRRCPPDEFPKLYPNSAQTEYKGRTRYKRMNQAILGLGSLLYLYVIYQHAVHGLKAPDFLPIVLGMVQFTPLAFLEISEFQQFKLMRQAEKRRTRSADLTPRRIRDFVPMKLWIVALVLFSACVIYDFAMHDFSFAWSPVVRTISLLLCNALFVFIIAFNLYGKKMDPHQSSGDRERFIRANASSLGMISIAVSVFFMVTITLNGFELDQFEVVANSLYFQFVAVFGVGSLMKSMSLDDVDFEVYRKDPVSQ